MNVRWRMIQSVTQFTIGWGAGRGGASERRVSAAPLVRRMSSIGGVGEEGCAAGPDAGPKLDMRDILYASAAQSQAG